MKASRFILACAGLILAASCCQAPQNEDVNAVIENIMARRSIRKYKAEQIKDTELNAILEKYGCTSAVGLGSLTALLTVAAAAYALKKK